MAKGGSSGGIDIGLVVGNPILFVTIVLSVIGWLVAFIGQCAAESTRRNGVLWFGIFVELFVIIGVIFTLATDSVGFARFQVAAFTIVALVYSVTGIDVGIYGGPSSVKALSAGYFILTIVNVLWLLYFTAEEDSFGYNVLTSLGNGGLTGPGRSGGVRGQNIRVGGPAGGHSNGSAYSGGYGGATAASGYQPAYGNSPSAAELSGAPKAAAASLRSGAPKSAGPGSQGHGGPGSDYGAVNSPVSRGTGLDGAASTTPGGDPLPDYGYRAKALYAYQANADDPTELSFSKGEILDIVDNSGKWWQARTPNGETGIVPSNYMQLL